MRKTQDDAMARTVAENKIGDLLTEYGGGNDHDTDVAVARDVLSGFESVEFERTVSKVRGGPEVPLRRLVITGPLEVDPDGLTAE
jgi:hypothetical protein